MSDRLNVYDNDAHKFSAHLKLYVFPYWTDLERMGQGDKARELALATLEELRNTDPVLWGTLPNTDMVRICRVAGVLDDKPWMQDPEHMEVRFCPYCGKEGTVQPGRNASIEVFADMDDQEAEQDPEETLGAQENECKACDTRFFSI